MSAKIGLEASVSYEKVLTPFNMAMSEFFKLFLFLIYAYVECTCLIMRKSRCCRSLMSFISFRPSIELLKAIKLIRLMARRII